MPKTYNAKKKINTEIIQCRNNHATVIETIPPLNKSINKLIGINQTYDNNLIICQTDTSGLTAQKQDDRNFLGSHLLILSAKFNLFAFQEGLEELYAKTKTTQTDIDKASSTELSALTEHYFNIAEEYKDKWPQIGATQEEIDEILNAKERFNNSIVKPDNQQVKVMKAHKALRDNEQENNAVIYQEILPTVRKVFGSTHPEIVQEIEAILNINKVGSNKLAVMGQVVNATTGQAVTHAIIEMEEIELERRLRSKEGLFRIHNLPEGQHILRCTHPEFQTQEFTFIHVWGITTKLLLKLQPIPNPTPSTKTTETQAATVEG